MYGKWNYNEVVREMKKKSDYSKQLLESSAVISFWLCE